GFSLFSASGALPGPRERQETTQNEKLVPGKGSRHLVVGVAEKITTPGVWENVFLRSTPQEISEQYPTAVTPAGFTFAIPGLGPHLPAAGRRHRAGLGGGRARGERDARPRVGRRVGGRGRLAARLRLRAPPRGGGEAREAPGGHGASRGTAVGGPGLHAGRRLPPQPLAALARRVRLGGRRAAAGAADGHERRVARRCLGHRPLHRGAARARPRAHRRPEGRRGAAAGRRRRGLLRGPRARRLAGRAAARAGLLGGHGVGLLRHLEGRLAAPG
ncbi:unnamed protein product, partial [Prorocentrum cordatum]